jgi:hypothetical protein
MAKLGVATCGHPAAPAYAAPFIQDFLHYYVKARHLRLGRFEFFDGQSTQPCNPTIGWLQTNRIAHLLIVHIHLEDNVVFSKAAQVR